MAQAALHALLAAAALSASAATGAPAAAAVPAPVAVPDTLAQRLLPCGTCHGAQGRASRSGYSPRIAGKPADYLYNQLRAFREGRRPHAAMAELLAPLSDEYLAEIARHFADLQLPYPAPMPAGRKPAAPDPRAEQLLQHGDPARGLPACRHCHGDALTGLPASTGAGAGHPATPGLLGLPRDYLVAQLGAWREGQRQATAPDCMARIARALQPAEITALADALAARPVPEPVPAPVVAGATAPAAHGPRDGSCGALPLPAPRTRAPARPTDGR